VVYLGEKHWLVHLGCALSEILVPFVLVTWNEAIQPIHESPIQAIQSQQTSVILLAFLGHLSLHYGARLFCHDALDIHSGPSNAAYNTFGR